MNKNANTPKIKASSRKNQLLDAIREHGGHVTATEVIKMNFSTRSLYQLVNEGKIEQMSRGIYRLSDMPFVSDPDFVTVALRSPKSLVCLISALSFHGITTQIPHEVSIALPKGAKTPVIDYPPIAVHRFSESSYHAGIEGHLIDGVNVRIYDVEKTLVDCFKFRNKIGMDIVLEALKLYRAYKPYNSKKLYEYANICRIRSFMKPYLEATL